MQRGGAIPAPRLSSGGEHGEIRAGRETTKREGMKPPAIRWNQRKNPVEGDIHKQRFIYKRLTKKSGTKKHGGQADKVARLQLAERSSQQIDTQPKVFHCHRHFLLPSFCHPFFCPRFFRQASKKGDTDSQRNIDKKIWDKKTLRTSHWNINRRMVAAEERRPADPHIRKSNWTYRARERIFN